MSDFTEDQRVALSDLMRGQLARINAEIARLFEQRDATTAWLAEHGTSAERCGDCQRPIDAHANFCPQFRWPS
ncbi:hypothetical protein AB0M54_24570 [Actinoplanes sp. NPDC051470]|uniref:hypothetical protein n=1 Tax=Actinoplanes sp. NPDC051470 TaxID=3157224 RepID=UPI00343CA7EF